jgi:2,3-bisphosphoglycerate-dependent phosphoglycerate mutase
MMSGKLIITRHSESEWNLKGVWTGITDVGLTDKGHEDAQKIGELLKDLRFDKIYTSQLKRANETRDDLLSVYGETAADLRRTAAINERDYGDYMGLNKWEVKEKVGEDEFKDLRRAFDAVIPNGETLRDVYERVVPWYREIVLPQLLDGKNVLIVAHGNSDRALRKYLENVSDEGVKKLEMDFDKVYIYDVDTDGRATNTEMRHIETDKSHQY